MSSPQLTARASELTVARTPFVRATVVRAQAPTSVQAGNDAIVLADGTLEGFVGGQCTQNSVRTAALAALAESTATLLRVLPDDSDPFPATPGAQVVVNPCHSGGAVEIFLEPVLPPPMLSVTGRTPIAEALRSMASFLGYAVIDPPPESARMEPEGRTEGDLAGCSAVLLASHGPGEAETIRAALDAGVPYIGLVASRKRSAALFDEMGLDEDQRSRIDSPAGQWIGARTAPEIALSIMADVVAKVRLEHAAPGMTSFGPAVGGDGAATPVHAPGSPVDAAPRDTAASTDGSNSEGVSTASARGDPGALTPVQAIDPICQMTVTVMPDTPHLAVDGVDYYFCNPGCRKAFAAQHPSESAERGKSDEQSKSTERGEASERPESAGSGAAR